MRTIRELLYPVCTLAAYSVWGLLLSAALFAAIDLSHVNRFAFAALAIFIGGLLPFAQHLFEVHFRHERFSWGVIAASLTLGGVVTLLFGSFLQALLLVLGIHSIFGLPIDDWSWRFPDWMTPRY